MREIFTAKITRSAPNDPKIYPSVNLIQTRDKENLILARLAELSVTFVKVHLNISPIDLIEEDVSESDHVQNFPRHLTETLK